MASAPTKPQRVRNVTKVRTITLNDDLIENLLSYNAFNVNSLYEKHAKVYDVNEKKIEKKRKTRTSSKTGKAATNKMYPCSLQTTPPPTKLHLPLNTLFTIGGWGSFK